MKKLLTVLLAVAMLIMTLTGCSYQGSSVNQGLQEERRATQALQEQSMREVGMPNITNFTEKKLLKMLYELRDDATLSTHTYVMGRNGYMYLGPSIGFGIPYSTQYTQPETLQRVRLKDTYAETHTSYTEVLPQADPNGLYTPTGLSATWVMLVDPETGSIKPAYVEQEITVRMDKMPVDNLDPAHIPANY